MQARLFYIAKDFQLYDLVSHADMSDPQNPFFAWVFPQDAFVIGVRAVFENEETLQDIREQFTSIEDLYHVNSGNHLTFEMLRDVDFRHSGTEFILTIGNAVLPYPEIAYPSIIMHTGETGLSGEVQYFVNLHDADSGDIIEENPAGNWKVFYQNTTNEVEESYIKIEDGVLWYSDECPAGTYTVQFTIDGNPNDTTGVFNLSWLGA